MLRNLTRFTFAALLAAGWMFAAEAKKVNSDELEKILQNEKNLFLLDVREPSELEELGTLKGYVNIPLKQLEGRLKEVPKDKTIVTMCRRGVRASSAAEILEKHGYKVLAACGLDEWRAKNKPLIYPKAKAN